MSWMRARATTGSIAGGQRCEMDSIFGSGANGT
jgi:hypothetical protein